MQEKLRDASASVLPDEFEFVIDCELFFIVADYVNKTRLAGMFQFC